jgi:hypothetical protein
MNPSRPPLDWYNGKNNIPGPKGSRKASHYPRQTYFWPLHFNIIFLD